MKLGEWLLQKLGASNFVSNLLQKELEGRDLNLTNYNDDKIKKYYQTLNKLWHSGNALSLENFFKLNVNPEVLKTTTTDSSFWKWVNKEPQITKIHSSFPAAVSQQMSSLLFSEIPVMDVKTGNKETDKRINKVLDKILDDNNINNLILNGAQLESYSSGIAAKFSIDREFSDYPIIEFYPAEDVEIRTKYGRVFEIVFSDVYTQDNKTYLLHSIYSYGSIKYKLYELREDGSKKNVNLNKCEETKSLRDIYILDDSGKPLNIILAAYKNNKANGTSDYDGLSDEFNELDSYESLMANYFRYGSKIKCTFRESELEKDREGNIRIPERWGVDAIVLKDSNPEDTQQGIDREIPLLDIQAFTDAITHVKKAILDKVGLAYSSFGLGSSGAGEAAEALAIREQASYRTRQEKLQLWEPFLQNLCRLCLIYFDVLNNNPQNMEDKTVFIVNNPYDFDYQITFSPYEVQSDRERAEDIKAILDTGLITQEDAIREYWKNTLSEDVLEEKIQEVLNKKKEINKSMENTPENIDSNKENINE